MVINGLGKYNPLWRSRRSKTRLITHLEILVANVSGILVFSAYVLTKCIQSIDEMVLKAGFFSAILSYIEENNHKINHSFSNDRLLELNDKTGGFYIKRIGQFFFAISFSNNVRSKSQKLLDIFSNEAYHILIHDCRAYGSQGCLHETSVKLNMLLLKNWKSLHSGRYLHILWIGFLILLLLIGLKIL